jgi:hypothetical protein
MYQEDENSTVTHNSQLYSVNKLLAVASEKPTSILPTRVLLWVLFYSGLSKSRVQAADYSYPLIVTKDNTQDTKNHLVVLDGAHRLAKAVLDKKKLLPVKYISSEELANCLA